MKIGITYRLFLAILAATLLAVACMFLVTQWSLDRGFLRYVNNMEKRKTSLLASRLEESYGNHGNWDFLRSEPHLWLHIVGESPPEEPGDNKAPRPPLRAPSYPAIPSPLPGAAFHSSPRMGSLPYFVLDEKKVPLVSSMKSSSDAELTPLHSNGRIVGYLGVQPHPRITDIRRHSFIKGQKFASVAVSCLMVLLATALSFPLAYRVVRPVRALAAATRRLSAGDYAIRVPESSGDELGSLARDFNALATTLEKNEKARRQWVADISHELRTPLAVLQGEVEAIQDGIRQPDSDSIRSLHSEVMRLNRLVDDLYQLSMSDLGALTYRKEELDMREPLSDALALFRRELEGKGIHIQEQLPNDDRVRVFGDHQRLRQLFTNLLDNSLKYTEAGGRLEIRLAQDDGMACIDLMDSAPGVHEIELEKLFERLYRVETSRNRNEGGAGLGLAICRNIVEAHSGNIEAKESPLGGVWIKVTIPMTEKGR